VPVFAGKAHYVTLSGSLDGTTVSVDFKVAGLGNIEQISVVVTADAACVNPGTKKPKAANKQSFSATADFPVQNGKAEGSIELTATFTPDCTPPMEVQFSNVQITVYGTDEFGETDLNNTLIGTRNVF
jgi:hypothetical protein